MNVKQDKTIKGWHFLQRSETEGTIRIHVWSGTKKLRLNLDAQLVTLLIASTARWKIYVKPLTFCTFCIIIFINKKKSSPHHVSVGLFSANARVHVWILKMNWNEPRTNSSKQKSSRTVGTLTCHSLSLSLIASFYHCSRGFQTSSMSHRRACFGLF